MQLYQKYRPRRLAQVLGQSKTVARLRAIIRRPDFDRGALWISGDSGKGKTTIAECLARELGALRQSKDAWTFTELDGDKCSVESVRDLDDCTRAAVLWSNQWRVWVINEAHAMTAKAVQAWLTLLERLPERWLIMFTTTENLDDLFGNFNHPFASRVQRFKLTNQGLCELIARFAHRIATREKLNGQPVEAYHRLVKNHKNNIRAVLQAVEAGDMME